MLGAWYLFTMLQKVFFGPLHEPDHHGEVITDLNGRELVAILFVAIPCLLLRSLSTAGDRGDAGRYRLVAGSLNRGPARTEVIDP